MHRDLKPDNIIFKNKKQLIATIVDFGLATDTRLPEYLYTRCGTPGFVAPEIASLKNSIKVYDSICDVFSMGVVMHMLITGKSLFSSKNYNEALALNKACNLNF
jgi:serine/threonine protein kinase